MHFQCIVVQSYKVLQTQVHLHVFANGSMLSPVHSTKCLGRFQVPGRGFPGGISRAGNSREIPVAREFPGAREFPVAREFPGAREFPVAREIPVVREIPGNSRTGNSREGNFPGLTGGRVREFPVEHHWTRSHIVGFNPAT